MSHRKGKLHQEQSQEPEDRKGSFQNYIKRLILGFFAIMLALTFVSRAADSALVAKITVTSARKGELEFTIHGSGTITDHAKQYLDIYEGVHVSQVLVEKGRRVEPGDPLFQYSPQDLEEQLEKAQNEVLRAEISYEKAKLSYEAVAADSASEAAELSLQRAELDLITAEQDLQMAKDKIDRQRQKSCEASRKSYEEALVDYTKQEGKKNRAIEKANLAVEEAEQVRSCLNEDRTKSEAVLSEYRIAVEDLTENAEDIVSGVTGKEPVPVFYNLTYFISNVDNKFFSILNNLLMNTGDAQAALEQSKEQSKEQNKEQQTSEENLRSAGQEEIDRIIKAEENIFKNYYGDKEYEAHLKEVEEANQNLERKKEDYSCSVLIAMESGRNLTMEEKMSYIRMYEDAEAALAELTKEDLKLNGAITAYGNAILKKDAIEEDNTYAALFELIYQEDDAIAQKIEAADKGIADAREALNETTAEWDDTLQEKQEEVEELLVAYQEEEEVYKQITEVTYDYTEEVRAEEKQVQSATRAVTDAKANVENANENDWEAAQKKQKEEELRQLDYELYELELEEKKKAAEAVEMLLDQEGIVSSPVTGYAASIGIEAGSITTGTEIVAIAVEECGFQAFVTKEEAKRIEQGDEIKIKIGNSNEEIIVPVTGIGAEDLEGRIEITGIMPEGEYSIGTVVSYQLTKQSKKYQQTIPINALHSDSHGSYYVLVPEEKNTVLGNELVARRIAITLIDKDYTTAAIEGDVYSVDIIAGSNKNIEEGDRVRIEVE